MPGVERPKKRRPSSDRKRASSDRADAVGFEGVADGARTTAAELARASRRPWPRVRRVRRSFDAAVEDFTTRPRARPAARLTTRPAARSTARARVAPAEAAECARLVRQDGSARSKTSDLAEKRAARDRAGGRGENARRVAAVLAHVRDPAVQAKEEHAEQLGANLDKPSSARRRTREGPARFRRRRGPRRRSGSRRSSSRRPASSAGKGCFVRRSGERCGVGLLRNPTPAW